MKIAVNNQQDALPIDIASMERIASQILADACYTSGTLSVAVVDDPTIHKLNVEFLQHDYPTDVLSFALEDDGEHLQGEVIISAETAIENAAEYGWPAEHELLLYLIHGTLHLAGYGDKSDHETAAMREAETRYLGIAGIALPTTATQLPTSTTQGASPQ